MNTTDGVVLRFKVEHGQAIEKVRNFPSEASLVRT